jgi:rod shape-determining protein MreC
VTRSRARSRPFFIAAGVVLVLLILGVAGADGALRSPGRAALSPLTSPLHRIGVGAREAFSGLGELGQLRRQNRLLEERAKSQAAEIARLRDLEAENRDLRGELGLPLFHEFVLVSAEVIARSSVGDALTLNRGSRDGLAPGMAVVKSGSLVGQLGGVERSSAELRLLSDPRVEVPALAVDDRLQGLVQSENGRLKLRFIPTGGEIRRGTRVTSSGLGEAFPSGLLIGEVARVERSQDGLFQEVTLKPAIDPVGLRGVFVMTGRRP